MAVFSWAAALAPSFGWLIAFRALQSIANASTLPAVMGIISEIFPTDSMTLWSDSTPPWVIVITLVIAALGILDMLRFISGTFGATVFGIILESVRSSGSNPLQALSLGFYLVTAVAALAVVLALVMPRPPALAVATVD